MLSQLTSQTLRNDIQLGSCDAVCAPWPGITAAWQSLCCDPALARQRTEQTVRWLPCSIATLLLHELGLTEATMDGEGVGRGGGGSHVHRASPRTARTPLTEKADMTISDSTGASLQKGTKRAPAVLPPLRPPPPPSAAAAAAALTPRVPTAHRGEQSCDVAALTLLSLLLAPLVEGVSSAQCSAAQKEADTVQAQLEAICAVLLRHLTETSNTAVPEAAVTLTPAECGLLADAQRHTLADSLHAWLRYFFFFFMHQLYEERRRLASVRATEAHLRRTATARRLPPPATQSSSQFSSSSQKPSAARSLTAEMVKARRCVDPEAALLRAHPSLRHGHHAQAFAQSVHEAANTIVTVLHSELRSDTTLSRRDVLHQRLKLPGSVTPCKKTTPKQARQTRLAVPYGKRVHGRGGAGCRSSRRRIRESSSESSSSSSSALSEVTTSDDDANYSHADSSEDNAAEEKEAAKPGKRSAAAVARRKVTAEEDEDLPLSVLASKMMR